jgi:hypothetical protein
MPGGYSNPTFAPEADTLTIIGYMYMISKHQYIHDTLTIIDYIHVGVYLYFHS